eukprot:scaffold21187_cov54-Attheya_sp.AAC.6
MKGMLVATSYFEEFGSDRDPVCGGCSHNKYRRKITSFVNPGGSFSNVKMILQFVVLNQKNQG